MQLEVRASSLQWRPENSAHTTPARYLKRQSTKASDRVVESAKDGPFQQGDQPIQKPRKRVGKLVIQHWHQPEKPRAKPLEIYVHYNKQADGELQKTAQLMEKILSKPGKSWQQTCDDLLEQ